MEILIVEDEVELAAALQRLLEREGYRVDTAADGSVGAQLATTQTYNLLIFDWMLPKVSGLELCRERRTAGDTTPILILTAKDTIDDRVAGLDAGADDYIVKPFELREFLARVRALLRRSPTAEETEEPPVKTLKFGDLELQPDNQLAFRGGKVLQLSGQETRLLECFLRHPGQVLGQQQLRDWIWQEGEQPSSNVVAALVRLLRRKIEVAGTPSLIRTVYGKGYSLGDRDAERSPMFDEIAP
ncbi:MAG: response regulator transcription factor [Cyanobacteria bacterium J06641_5]